MTSIPTKSASPLGKALLSLAVLALSAAATPAFAEAPPQSGVYECMTQDGLAPTLMLGLLDGANYSNYDGKTGHYRYDPKARQVIIIDGPFKGFHFLRGENPDPATGRGSLRMLDEHNQLTAINCPHNPVKDAHKHPW